MNPPITLCISGCRESADPDVCVHTNPGQPRRSRTDWNYNNWMGVDYLPDGRAAAHDLDWTGATSDLDWAGPGDDMNLPDGLTATVEQERGPNGWPTIRVEGPREALLEWLGEYHDEPYPGSSR